MSEFGTIWIITFPGLVNRLAASKIDGIEVIAWAADHNADAVWDARREIAYMLKPATMNTLFIVAGRVHEADFAIRDFNHSFADRSFNYESLWLLE